MLPSMRFWLARPRGGSGLVPCSSGNRPVCHFRCRADEEPAGSRISFLEGNECEHRQQIKRDTKINAKKSDVGPNNSAGEWRITAGMAGAQRAEP